jgi:signal transduction histidine kinase
MVVEAHGGTIGVQSASSAGTVFEVILPTVASMAIA